MRSVLTLSLLCLVVACGDKDDSFPSSAYGDDDTASSGDDGGGDDGGGDDGGEDSGDPDCDIVYIDFTGEVVTVASAPLGRDDLREQPVTGFLGYNPCIGDRDEADDRGSYRHAGSSEFQVQIDDLLIEGSGQATVAIVVPGSTWRFEDGEGSELPRSMSVNGNELGSLELWISTGPADSEAFTDDSIPEPDWLDAEAPHTFSISEAGGTILIQWDTLTLR